MKGFDEQDLELEKVKAKSHIYTITILSIIGAIIIFLILSIISIKKTSDDFFRYRETKYSIDINEQNKDKIIEILKQNENEYCESIYKIEYSVSFPDTVSLKIFCEDGESINLYESNQKLIDFVIENGTKEIN